MSVRDPFLGTGAGARGLILCPDGSVVVTDQPRRGLRRDVR